MPWTKAQDVTSQDVEAFEMMLDAIAEQDREAKIRTAYQFETSHLNRLMFDHAEAQPARLEPCHD